MTIIESTNVQPSIPEGDNATEKSDKAIGKELPIVSLAPMEDVTDTVFRQVILETLTSRTLNMVFTEFVSTDSLCHARGKDKVIHRLQVSPSERALLKSHNIKLIAQVWGTHPQHYRDAVQMICNDMEFDGIDVNMGCPVPKVVRKGACSGLIATPELAKELIYITKDVSNLPVSVKTRIGLKEASTEEWLTHVLETQPDMLTIHGRTQIMQSNGRADWNEIGKAIALRDALSPDTLIVGNGDVRSLEEINEKCTTHTLDGVMVGRGIFYNPWMFSPGVQPDKQQRLDLLWRHTELFAEVWQGTRAFPILRRFFKIYATNFRGASTLRNQLMSAESPQDVRHHLHEAGWKG